MIDVRLNYLLFHGSYLFGDFILHVLERLQKPLVGLFFPHKILRQLNSCFARRDIMLRKRLRHSPFYQHQGRLRIANLLVDSGLVSKQLNQLFERVRYEVHSSLLALRNFASDENDVTSIYPVQSETARKIRHQMPKTNKLVRS
jgi:hypothetical protein